MDFFKLAAELESGASEIARCLEDIERGKQAKARLPKLLNAQATMALNLKYYAESHEDVDDFIAKVRDALKGAENEAL